MGSCLCKEKKLEKCSSEDCHAMDSSPDNSSDTPNRINKMDPEQAQQLIREVLTYIGGFPNDGDTTPPQLSQLNTMADSKEGWLGVIHALIHTIPLEDRLGASTISVIMDDCPLPAKETVLQFVEQLNLCRERADNACDTVDSITEERNVLVILSYIAEKFGGPQCLEILDEDLMGYLLTFIMKQEDPTLVIHALVALEKFANNKEGKAIVEAQFRKQVLHPMIPLDLHYGCSDYMWRQVGFLARWALDNTFEIPGRQLTYETQDMSNINAILNVCDTSEYLKISADGLEARCDSHSFESCRATFKIESGCWYYEVELITPGVMQIGWASKDAKFLNQEGYGVGDDPFSLAYDGCRRLVWHCALPIPEPDASRWEPGDTLGCLIDIGRQEAVFTHNGNRVLVRSDVFTHTRTTVDSESGACSEGFYPAASFMAHQQCRFNFGASPFKHPPHDRPFKIINQHGTLTAEEKKIVPRRKIIEQIRLEDCAEDEGTCKVCYSALGAFGIHPCKHDGFCHSCAYKLSTCPMCRHPIEMVYKMLL